MNTMTIEEFCDKHHACEGGRDWALSTGATDMAILWRRDDIRPTWRVWIATRTGVMSDREARLFACWCVRQVRHLLADERSKHAAEVSERYANGLASCEELAAARDAASDAAWDAAWDAASDAAWWAAAWDAQAKYLIANITNPNFEAQS